MTRYYKNIILFAFNSNPSRRGSSMIHPRRSLPSPNASPTQPVFRFSPNPHQHATREPSEKAGIMRVDIDFSRHFHFSTALAERAERNVKVLPFEIFCLHAILSWILRNSVKGGKSTLDGENRLLLRLHPNDIFTFARLINDYAVIRY